MTSSKQENQSIFDRVSYEATFTKDLRQVKKVTISIAKGHRLKLQQLLGLIKGVSLDVYVTRDKKNQTLIQQLAGTGISVYERDTPLPTFTILDEDIVWFGQLPMFTQQYDKDDPMFLRIESESMVQEFKNILES
ncbi:hypothetical protein AB6M99_07665 [Streptococcus hillyeri]|uniref:hypothetical protein n=1 Tax=Streptococcus hillyeri TaxID=2282420 RepID=UPI0034E21329